MLRDLAAAINIIIFSPQWLNIPFILQESADATCRQPHAPLPLPSLLNANFVATRKNIFGFSWESNQKFHGGNLTLQPPCYQIMLCSEFYSWFNPITTVQDCHGHIPLFSCCTRHFSQPHHAPMFSWIYPLGGKGRHGSYLWKLAGEMLPFSGEQSAWY